jgi:Cytochrome c554 and c-prime
MIRWFALASGCAIALSAQSGSRSDYVGAARCAVCHADKFATQRASEHAHALSRPIEHSLSDKFIRNETFVRSGKYRFQFIRTGTDLHVRAFDDTRQIEVPLEWAFGAGSQAVTFASQANRDWYLEHAFSYYAGAGSYAATPGQPAPAADTLAAALGRLFRSGGENGEMRSCFGCHSTGPITMNRSGLLEPTEPGVHCEACHGPGRMHSEAPRKSIQNPGHMSAADLSTFCGKCHREPAAAGVEIDWSVAWNVRHQPVYLSQAACFRGSADALSCLTCHDPHGSLRKDDAFYNAKCDGCHNQTARPPGASCGNAASHNCVGCHMPRVSPQSWLRFTNHWIGIYKEGNGLKPQP